MSLESALKEAYKTPRRTYLSDIAKKHDITMNRMMNSIDFTRVGKSIVLNQDNGLYYNYLTKEWENPTPKKGEYGRD